ncbi:J domain-containing protein [Bradyrhizobium sp. Ash2021]|uniref:J domain-containing protein n=1 Tax=Bradyrhizobium sp. Ash2021 TaxID=2954771 RepID=UPI002814F6A3|nr:J domain-containing protein [Bradyrhizobium sp. Ash2021]WMT73365.1 J domain-containing protein [Bradyrhizobium sp. Ash2021]
MVDRGWHFSRIGWSLITDMLFLPSRFWLGVIFDQPADQKTSEGGRAWFEILEVQASASSEQIKKAYREQMKKYHPDRVSDLGLELQHLALVTAKEINRAYQEAKQRF